MNDLITKTDKAVQISRQLGLQAAIKPLEKEVFLQDVFVYDVFLNGDRLSGLRTGDPLQLKREPQPYDEWIVGVYSGDARIGELAEFNEEIFAHLLDAGKNLTAKVKNVVTMPEYASLEISITLVDY